jgi:hypothetical protein
VRRNIDHLIGSGNPFLDDLAPEHQFSGLTERFGAFPLQFPFNSHVARIGSGAGDDKDRIEAGGLYHRMPVAPGLKRARSSAKLRHSAAHATKVDPTRQVTSGPFPGWAM